MGLDGDVPQFLGSFWPENSGIGVYFYWKISVIGVYFHLEFSGIGVYSYTQNSGYGCGMKVQLDNPSSRSELRSNGHLGKKLSFPALDPLSF